MRTLTLMLGLVLGAALLQASLPGGAALAGEAAITAELTGKSGHKTEGTLYIEKTAEGGYRVRLGDDFDHDGAPDPWLGFGAADGPDGKDRIDTATLFSTLDANTGAQSYDLPEDVDPMAHDNFYVWCKKYAVPLGVAKIKK